MAVDVQVNFDVRGNLSKGLTSLTNQLFNLRNAAIAFTSALGVGELVEVANIQEDAVNRLNTALASAGDFSDQASIDLQNYASQLQQASRFGDELILTQLALAKSYGATNDQAKQLVQASADLAAETGISLESATQRLAKSLGGVAGELADAIPEIRQLTAEQLRAGEAINIVAERFSGAALASIDTFSGRLTQAKNSFGDLLEELGFLITQNPAFIQALAEANSAFISLIDSVKSNREGLTSFINGALQLFGKVVIKIVQIVQFWNRSILAVRIAFFELGQAVNSVGTGVLSILGKVSTTFKEAAENSEKLGLEARSAFAEAIDGQVEFDESLTKLTKGIDQSFTRIEKAGDKRTKSQIKNIKNQNKELSATEKIAKKLNDLFSSQRGGAFGAFATAVTQGAQGVSTLFSTIAESFLPGIGPLVGLLGSGSKEEVRQAVQSFTDAIPAFIEGLIENLPVFVEALINSIPRLINAFVSSIPRIVRAFSVGLIASIPQIVAGFAQAFIDLINSVIDFVNPFSGGFLGIFHEGGLVPGNAQNVPIIAQGGEQVLSRDLTQELSSFLKGSNTNNIKSGGLEVINVDFNQKNLARIFVDLDSQNERTTFASSFGNPSLRKLRY